MGRLVRVPQRVEPLAGLVPILVLSKKGPRGTEDMKTKQCIVEEIERLKQSWYSVDNYYDMIDIERRLFTLCWVLDDIDDYETFMREESENL